MLRGMGRLQNGLLLTIRRCGKPMTFADIRASIIKDLGAEGPLRASFERSLRRALHRLSSDQVLIALGDGGPGDPLRYFIHPLLIGMTMNDPEAHALLESLEAEIGHPLKVDPPSIARQ